MRLALIVSDTDRHQRIMQDTHLIDRMLAAWVLTSAQYEVAERVAVLHTESGFEPRQVAGYAPRGFSGGHDDDRDQRYAVTRFRQFLKHVTASEALALHGMALCDMPSARGWRAFVMRLTAWPNVGGSRSLIPEFDGTVFSREWKEALWARFSMAAP